MTALIEAGAAFLGAVAPLIARAATARQEEHAEILARAQAAAIAFQQAVEGLAMALMMNDRKADEALQQKFDHSQDDPTKP